MKLKSLIVAVVAFVASAVTMSASAQSGGSLGNGELEVGGKINIYSRWDSAVGIGVYGRLGLTENLRVEPSFLYYCNKGASIEIAGDLHYVVDVTDQFEFYPLVGLTLNDPYKFGVGLNLGAGMGFNITDNWGADFGLKWILQSQKYIKNPVVLSFGLGYKF